MIIPFSLKRPTFCSLILLLAVLPLFLNACGRSSVIKKNPRLQHFTDKTRQLLAKTRGPLKFAKFVHANGDGLIDLVVLKETSDGPVVETWINRDEESFDVLDRTWKGAPSDRVTEMEIGDFNRDRTHEVVLMGEFSGDSRVKMLTNNGRGYYFEDVQKPLPSIKSDMDRMDVVDLDGDHNPDMLFYNSRQDQSAEAAIRHPVQFLLNIGEGFFQDRTKLLWPLLPSGIAGAVYADYDNDRTLDVFLYYAQDKNVILMNNGLGQLTNTSGSNLPPLKNKAVHSDWADFDQDGDQDLIVLTRGISDSGREYEKELHYGLENNGQGYFTKRTLKFMPPFPVNGIYLLDGDGDEWPDMILLADRATYYLSGKGPWKYAIETKKRLPGNPPFREITFGDVNDDGYLDLLGITPQGQPHLWVTEF